ncbi:multiubiquitin domain-containing protein [Cupriavidus neocaledonicus]|nr:multiubiquitin domain-containing protein [Cupriavidus neocaledonicus]
MQHNEFQIFVNTAPHKVPGPEISFEKILELAGINIVGVDLGLYDVDYKHGNNLGSLTPGKTAKLENGMKFDAGKSNRS